MISRKRLFERRPPYRGAKTFYIFCEGVKREYQYFLYFEEIDSKINVVPIEMSDKEDNSPTGLYHKKAAPLLLKTEANPNPKYELLKDDEAWFVIDTDKWGKKIDELRNLCTNHENWNVAQSNPCFEVWLYYHFKDTFPLFEGMEVSKNWKRYINSNISLGGFDSRKHPVFISTAINNSRSNYKEEARTPAIGTTQVHQLGQQILPLIKETIKEGIAQIQKNNT